MNKPYPVALTALMASFLVLGPRASAQPAPSPPYIFFRSILNAASFAPHGAPNGPLARGSIFSIFGRNLGPAEGRSVTSFPLSPTLAGVSVEVCQAATCVAALPLFAGANQVNAIMPSHAPLGPVSLRITFNGVAGNFSPAEVVPSSLGVFAVNSGGFGPGIVQNFITQESQPVNSSQMSARPGQTVILWGTGLGPALNADNVAPQAGDLPVAVDIWVGGRPVTVKRYSGRTPCCAGVDQIIFDIPADAPLGCYVPVTVRAGGVVSNTVTIAITGDGTTSCSDPANPFNAARGGGRTGIALLTRMNTTSMFPELTADLVSIFFQHEPTGPWHFNRLYSLPPPGSCATYTKNEGELTTSFLADLAANGPHLAAAETISVNGPAGQALARPLPNARNFHGLVAAPNFSFAQVMSLLFGDSAPVRISAAGGADIGAFDMQLMPPPRLTWTNRNATATVRRGQTLDLNWTGGDPQGVVVITAFSRQRGNMSSSGFVCTAPAAANRFEVPGWITATLTGSGGETDDGILVLSALPAAATMFTANGLDRGFGLLTSTQSRVIHVE